MAGEGHAATSSLSLITAKGDRGDLSLTQIKQRLRILQRGCRRRSKIGLLIRRQPVSLKEEEQLCGICTPDLGEILCCDATDRPLHRELTPDERERLAKTNSPWRDQQTRPTRQDAETKPASSSKNRHSPPHPPKTNWSGLSRELTYTHACLHKLFPDRPWALEFD